MTNPTNDALDNYINAAIAKSQGGTGAKNLVPVPRTAPRSSYGGIFGGALGALLDLGYMAHPSYSYQPSSSPGAQAEIGNARMRYLAGQATLADFNVLMAAGEVSPADYRAYIKQYGSPGGGDGSTMTAAEAAASARADRAQRMAEVQDAQNALQQRVQAAQQARLAGAQYAVTPSMLSGPNAGYFPALGPTSPLVQAGLAQPLQFQPIAFNPERGVNLDQAQIAKDLATIRGLAGY